MTTGNIGFATDTKLQVSNVAAKSSTNSVVTETTQDFQSFFGGSKGEEIKVDNKPVATKTEVENVIRKTQLNEKTKIENDNADICEIEDSIRDVIIDELDITVEEFEMALNNLGLEVVDLLQPQNVALLIAEVENVQPVDILTDADLTGLLTDVTDSVNQVIETAADSLNVDTEQFVEIIRTKVKTDSQVQTENDIPLESIADNDDVKSEVFVVKDESTGREIKVETTAATTETEVVSEADTATDFSNDDNQAKQDTKDSDSGRILNNLVDSVNRAVENSQVENNIFDNVRIDAEDIISQINEAVKVRVKADTTSMEIQLTPENLGKINLNVSTKNGVVTATITAANDTVKAVIENQLIQLKDNLANQGLEVAKVEVAVASHEFSMEGNESDNNADGRKGRNSHRRFRTDAELFDDTKDFAEQQLMETNGNSVSYTA